MKLNRNNYEEYFILYVDNELDSDGRQEVEGFANQHPDLKAELELLMHSKLTPDASIKFADKGSLIRFDNSSISLANYEEWLTSYIDNELSDGERRDVEVFVAGNPSIQRELNLLQQAKLQPEVILFPHKESLYRREEKPRVVTLRWWRIAAAAVLLIGLSTTTVLLLNNRTNDNGTITNVPVKEQPPVATVNSSSSANPKKNEASAVTPSNEVKDHGQPPVVKAKQSQRSGGHEEKTNEEGQIAKADNHEKNTIPDQPADKNAVAGRTEPETPIIRKEALTTTNDNVTNNAVTSAPSDTYIDTKGSDKQETNADIQFASQDNGGSNKGLRGFLRKVTRTFEKRTNIKATDDDDRLLIAGLAIKL